MTKAKADKSASDRKAYTVPAIRDFGTVGALTQGGTGAMVEGAMQQMNMNRRP